MYQQFFKRLIDMVLSAVGIVITAVPMLIIAFITRIDTPGSAIFHQKRYGIHKEYFYILKFRSLPQTASPDKPTHLMDDKIELTRWQRFLRKSSLDELPQLFCIFCGTMSIVGPRPALWNQDDLIAERDRYGANDIKPGLTGWAQINGRDELEIPVKAKLDGEYTRVLNQGGFKAFGMDMRCFFGSVLPVLRRDGVVDGVSGARDNNPESFKQTDVKP